MDLEAGTQVFQQRACKASALLTEPFPSSQQHSWSRELTYLWIRLSTLESQLALSGGEQPYYISVGDCLEPSAEAPSSAQKLGDGAVCLLLIFLNHNARVLEKGIPPKHSGPKALRVPEGLTHPRRRSYFQMF